jgi:hypothetical protein
MVSLTDERIHGASHEFLDAIPKKRGPKTDVLEALLKRVDGLEKRLKDEKTNQSSDPQSNGQDSSGSAEENGGHLAQRPKINTASRDSNDAGDSALFSPIPDRYVVVRYRKPKH